MGSSEPLKKFAAVGSISKLISRKPENVFPSSRIRYVLPTCLAPLTKRAFLSGFCFQLSKLSRKKRCITYLLQAMIENQYSIIKAIISKKCAKVKAIKDKNPAKVKSKKDYNLTKVNPLQS